MQDHSFVWVAPPFSGVRQCCFRPVDPAEAFVIEQTVSDAVPRKGKGRGCDSQRVQGRTGELISHGRYGGRIPQIKEERNKC